MSHSPPVAHRTVKPRKPSPNFRPILVWTPDGIYREMTDNWLPASDIFALVATEKPSIIVAEGIAQLLLELHRKFHRHPMWQFGCSPIELQRWSSNRQETMVRRHDTAVHFLGFRGKPLPDGPRGGKRNEPNRYHATLDPVTFGRRNIADMGYESLYIWASEVRQFCYQEGLTLRPTNGALSSQLLRDPRFYPWARRKVPAATNAKARDRLPGNHYRQYIDDETPVDAYYLDQVSSHHNCAKDIRFPHANELRAGGHFRTLRDKPGLPLRTLEAAGLHYIKLSIPHLPPGKFPPPWATNPGEHPAYLYSNELQTMRELGCEPLYVIATWSSNATDRGLNRYARWALTELETTPHTRSWKKQLLLSTYGILAATPRIHRVGYAHANGGQPAIYPAGAAFLPVEERATTKPTEPAYANVIQRGMIEAETRLRSLALARDLFNQGHRIIAVYADSVFVNARNVNDENLPLPIPPVGWQLEQVLTRLRFHNPVSFTSDQLQKLPGVPSRATVLRASFGTRAGKRATINT